MIDTLIFDAGNVLLRVENELIRKDISNTLRINPRIVSNAWNKLIPKHGAGKISEKEFWDKFFKLTNTQKRKIPKDLLVREYQKRFTTYDEVLAIVSNLKSNNYKLGIISDTIPSHANLLEKNDIFKPFDVVLLSYKIGLRRPDPKLFQMALQRLKSKPENSVFIDDVLKNINIINKLGLTGVVYENPKQLRLTLEKMGVNCQPPREVKETNIGTHALLITNYNEIILQQRSFQPYIANPGTIGIFGGTIKKNEGLVDGLKRELLEELALTIKDSNMSKLGVYEKTKTLDGIDHTSHVFLVKNVNFNELILKEGLDFVVGTVKELLKNKKLTRITRLALKDYSKFCSS